MIADSFFRTRRMTQSVGGVSGNLSAWSCIVAESYCFATVSLVRIVNKINSISFLSIRPMLATSLSASAPIAPLRSPLNCGDRSIPSVDLYWDGIRTRRVTQSVGGVSGDLSALFQMCSVATQPSLSLSKFIHSSKLGSDFQLREQAFGFYTFFWFGHLSTAATVRFLLW